MEKELKAVVHDPRDWKSRQTMVEDLEMEVKQAAGVCDENVRLREQVEQLKTKVNERDKAIQKQHAVIVKWYHIFDIKDLVKTCIDQE